MIQLYKKYFKGIAVAAGVLAPLAMLTEVILELQQPAMMSDIIDIGVAKGDLNYVFALGGKMFFIALITVLMGMLSSVLSNYAAVKTAGAIRKGLFEKIQTLSLSEIDHLGTSSLVIRLTNDVAQVQNSLNQLLGYIWRCAALFMGGVVMVYLLSPSLITILLTTLAVLSVFAVMIIIKVVPMYTTVQKRLDRINNVVRENLLGIRIVKAFTLENQRSKHFDEANEAMLKTNVRVQNTTFLLNPVVNLVMNLGIVAVLWFGGNMEISGAMANGKIIAVVNYMTKITSALLSMVNLIVNMSRAKVSAERINEVLEMETALKEPEKPEAVNGNDITFENVSFRYTTGAYVLKDLSFELKQGQRIGIIGATGSGKSTLVSLISRMYDVTKGSIKIGGKDVREISLSQLGKKVGIVMQESLLFSGTVEENLIYGNTAVTREEMIQAMKDAQAWDFMRKMPQGLDSIVEQRGKNFSGGQKQRLSIARTLIQKPEILIMDDASSALDFMTEARLQRAVKKWIENGTLIMVAQRITSIMDCDTVLVLDEGRLAAMGSHEKLMSECEIYRSIAVSQLGEEVLRYA